MEGDDLALTNGPIDCAIATPYGFPPQDVLKPQVRVNCRLSGTGDPVGVGASVCLGVGASVCLGVGASVCLGVGASVCV